MGNVKHVLEVGLLGGYTAIWIATLNPGIRITCLEVDPKHARVARENIERAGVANQVEIIVGPALETLPKIQAEIASRQRPRFGFTFIDAERRTTGRISTSPRISVSLVPPS